MVISTLKIVQELVVLPGIKQITCIKRLLKYLFGRCEAGWYKAENMCLGQTVIGSNTVNLLHSLGLHFLT